mgnify:CR=1 FL=1
MSISQESYFAPRNQINLAISLREIRSTSLFRGAKYDIQFNNQSISASPIVDDVECATRALASAAA